VADFVRAAALLSMLASTAQAAGGPPAPDWSKAAVVTVTLSDFAFAPNPLRLRRAVPVRLMLINRGSGGHSFSAPAFFAAAVFKPGSGPPPDGTVSLEKAGAAEVDLTPERAGSYPLQCTHFLHAFFGMTGTIEVVQ
jgi:plastocyanin